MTDGLLKFLAIRAAIGIATGWAVLAAFLILDVASLRTLMAQTSSTVPALILLTVFFAITFGSCAMGLGVMSQGGRGGGGGKRARTPPRPIAGALPVRAPARR
jgi:hypothetical protein